MIMNLKRSVHKIEGKNYVSLWLVESVAGNMKLSNHNQYKALQTQRLFTSNPVSWETSSSRRRESAVLNLYAFRVRVFDYLIITKTSNLPLIKAQLIIGCISSPTKKSPY